VADKVPPVLEGVPQNVTLACGTAIPSGSTVKAIDNCDPKPKVSFLDLTLGVKCPATYTITRVWTATDACGNTKTASQVISITNQVAPDSLEAENIKNVLAADTVVRDMQALQKAGISYLSTHKDSSLVVEVIANNTGNVPPFEVAIVVQAQRGTATFSPDTYTILYRPTEDLCGLDSFRYAISNSLGSDTATVFVRVLCEEVIIFSGFSPNGDGINDNFIISGLDKYPDNHLIVFNRWGNQVYDSTHYRNDWGGTCDGKALPEGTYFYLLELGQGSGDAASGGQKLTGYIQLQR